MAEIIGLITAIGTITAASFKITRAIATARDEFGAATASIKAIAADTAFVTVILGQIRDRINSRRVLNSETVKILEEIVSQCKDDIEGIERSLLPLIANIKSGAPMSKRQQMRWLFAKSKICSQQATLESLKLTLSLFIHTVQLSDGYNIEELKEEILDAISKSKDTKTTFLNAERVDQAVAKAYDMELNDGNGSTAQDITDDASVLAVEHVNSRTAENASLPLPVSDSVGGRAQKAEDDYDSANSQLQRLNMSELDMMQTISDDSFIRIAAHMQLQKSVAAFSLVIIDRRRPVEDLGAQTKTTAEPSKGISVDDGFSVSSISDEHSNAGPRRSAADSQQGESGYHVQPRAANDERRGAYYSPRPTAGTYSYREFEGGARPSTLSPEHYAPQPRSSWPYTNNVSEHPTRQWPNSFATGSQERPHSSMESSFVVSGGFQGTSPQDTPPYDNNTRTAFSTPPPSASYFGPYPPSGAYIPNSPPQPISPHLHRSYSSPPPDEPPTQRSDPEIETMRKQLERFKEEQVHQKEVERLAEMKESMRKDAENTFHRRMEEMQRAQEVAKWEIDKARTEAEQAAREKLEEERRAQARAERRHKEEMERARFEIRAEVERELEAEREKLRAELHGKPESGKKHVLRVLRLGRRKNPDVGIQVDV